MSTTSQDADLDTDERVPYLATFSLPFNARGDEHARAIAELYAELVNALSATERSTDIGELTVAGIERKPDADEPEPTLDRFLDAYQEAMRVGNTAQGYEIATVAELILTPDELTAFVGPEPNL